MLSRKIYRLSNTLSHGYSFKVKEKQLATIKIEPTKIKLYFFPFFLSLKPMLHGKSSQYGMQKHFVN